MMNGWAGGPTARNTRRPAAWPRPRAAAAAAAVALLAGAAVLAGCGQQVAGPAAGRAATPPAAAANLAAAANSGCVQASPVVQGALGVLTQLQRGAVTPAAARPQLATALTSVEKLARSTPDDVLQESLANAYDAFTAFQAVLQDPAAPAYQSTFSNLLGALSGFERTCSVANSSFTTGTSGWTAANGHTALTRSATAHDARWSLQVANSGQSPATAGFTDSPTAVATTLKGSEQIALWARALTGTPTITLQVQELSGGTVVGGEQTTMQLDSTFRFGYLTYHVRRPGASRLSVTVSAAGMAPGEAFLVDDITIVRD
jgi:hypothetical protein